MNKIRNNISLRNAYAFTSIFGRGVDLNELFRLNECPDGLGINDINSQ